MRWKVGGVLVALPTGLPYGRHALSGIHLAPCGTVLGACFPAAAPSDGAAAAEVSRCAGERSRRRKPALQSSAVGFSGASWKTSPCADLAMNTGEPGPVCRYQALSEPAKQASPLVALGGPETVPPDFDCWKAAFGPSARFERTALYAFGTEPAFGRLRHSVTIDLSMGCLRTLS